MQTNGVWIKTTDGAYIRADSITVLDVVDSASRGVTEHERDAHNASASVRGLVGHQGGDGLWYDLTERMRGSQAFAALRALISAMNDNGAGVLSHDSGEGWMLTRP
jgi:hypothetical protein